MESPITKEKADEICSHLESTAEMMDISLSFNVESIELIEEILLCLMELDDKAPLNGAEFMCGIYIGEIFRKTLNGNWVFNKEIQDHAIKINDTLIFPVAKVRQFTKNPKEDSLVLYAKVIFAKIRG